MQSQYMQLALNQAKIAFQKGEIPVGAVIVQDGKILVQTHNLKETLKDPTAHAEILAIREATAQLGDCYLTNATLYVTLEPCPMCAGALVQARVKELIFGAMDIKAGAAGSIMNIVEDKHLNHRIKVTAGIMEEECKAVLQRFFANKR